MRPAASPPAHRARPAARAPWRAAVVACVVVTVSACGRADDAASRPATDAPVPAADTAVMQPVPASPATRSNASGSTPSLLPPGIPAAPAQAQWKCADQRVAVRLDATSQSLSLVHERGQLVLPRGESASGARYADSNGNEFWDKGDEATLTLSGTPPRACTPVEGGWSD